MNKELIVLLVVVVAAVVWMMAKRTSSLSAKQARTYLEAGAVVVDVRTPEEFAAQRLPRAVNIPLQRLQSDLPGRVPDRSTVLLLHCRSGRRSGIAEKQLQAMGYTNAFNIGSYQRAQQILSSEPVP